MVQGLSFFSVTPSFLGYLIAEDFRSSVKKKKELVFQVTYVRNYFLIY